MSAAEKLVAPASEAARPRRVLIAEDNAVTNDLLRLLLRERGHEVDIVDNGEAALEALQKDNYDVVLMDFHLPKMDGLEVASSFRSRTGNARGPRFIAITSDMKGLLQNARDCETFDTLLPKPLDLDSICEVIEGEARQVRVCPGPPAAASLHNTSVMRPGPEMPQTIAGEEFNFLCWPDDFSGQGPSARGLQASLGSDSFDAIVIREPPRGEALAVIWRTKSLHVLPVIDLTGALGASADLDASRLAGGDRDLVRRLVSDFHDRRARVHPDLLYSDDVDDKLLARVFASGADLAPRHDAGEPSLVAFNTTLASAQTLQSAARLAARGLLAREFFDRMHVCDRCGSSRFNVREICTTCHSANLVEEAYLHHFKCAYQGPESDFRQGDDLVCPKCRLELAHFSVDYDKPGTVLKCLGCGESAFEASVGFVCLDCGANFTGDTVRTADAESYRLTEAARAYVEGGRAALGTAGGVLRFAEMPLALVIALNDEVKKFTANGTPFTMVEISYRNEREIAHEAGPRQFTRARDLFVENLRNGLRESDRVFRGQAYDFALLAGIRSGESHAGLEVARIEAGELLEHDLGVEMRVHSAEEFA